MISHECCCVKFNFIFCATVSDCFYFSLFTDPRVVERSVHCLPTSDTAVPSTNLLTCRCPLPGLQSRVPVRTPQSGVRIKISHRCETRPPGLALDVRDWFPATRIARASFGVVFKRGALHRLCILLTNGYRFSVDVKRSIYLRASVSVCRACCE